MISDQITLILSIQRALWSAIPPALRMVTASINQKEVHLRFYFDGPISEFNFDLADTASTEVIASFNDLGLNQEILRLDYPAKMPALEVVAYKRYEKPAEKKNLWNAIAQIFSSQSN